jgi:O-methyltransferase
MHMSWREFFHRLGHNPSFVLSHARSLMLDVCDSVSQQEFARIYRTVRPYTMCSNARLRGLYRAVQRVVSRNITGDLVECGAARGGSAALMGLTLQRLGGGAGRSLWVFDTFEGIPAPTQEDPDLELARAYTGGFRGEMAEVSSFFEEAGILGFAKLVKGLFQDTLPTCAVTSIAVLHIDGDWYDSVKCCLEHLYDRVSPGGVIQFDDYGHWAGARKAVDEFIARRQISARLSVIDYSGRQLIKPGGG